MPELTITLATCCRNRTEHLKQTLPCNLKDNPQDYVRFLLVNYNSQDDMDEWVRSELMQFIPSGKLMYVHEKTADRFKHAHARNLAVRCCQTDVFCNLDADNYTGPGFGQWLRKFYLDQTKAAFTAYGGRCRGAPSGDMFGRISFQTKALLALGGYNEDLNVWGVEDWDVIYRALQAGYAQGEYPTEFDTKAIHHSNKSRVVGTGQDSPRKTMEKTAKILLGKYSMQQQPNAKGQWGKAHVTVNWEKEVELPLKAGEQLP